MKKQTLALRKKLLLNKEIIARLDMERITGKGNTKEDCTVSICNDQCGTTWTLQPGCVSAACPMSVFPNFCQATLDPPGVTGC